MKRLLSLSITAAVVLVTAACSQKEPQPPEEPPLTFESILPGFSGAEIFLEGGATSGAFGDYVRWYFPAGDDSRTIVDLLNAADLTGFALYGGHAVGQGWGVPLRAVIDGTPYRISMLWDREDDGIQQTPPQPSSESCYLEVSDPSGTVQTFARPGADCPFPELDDLIQQIRQDTSDPRYSGTMEGPQWEEAVSLSRSKTAEAQSILEGTLLAVGPVEVEEGLELPWTFTIGDCSYSLDAASGFFEKRDGDSIVQSRLDENWAFKIAMILGLPFGE